MCSFRSFLVVMVILLFNVCNTRAAWREITEKAFKAYRAKNFTQAIDLTREALMAAEKEFGPESAEVAWSMADLAALYRVESKGLRERSIAIRNKLGKEGSRVGIATEVFFDEVEERRQQLPVGEPQS